MAKLIELIFLLSIINVLLQSSDCHRQKRGLSDFIIPGINVGDIAIDALKDLIFGAPVDKDQLIINKQLEHLEISRTVLSLTQKIAIVAENAPELTVLIQSLQKLPEYLNNINGAYRQYEVYLKSKRNGSDFRVHDFAKRSASRYIGPLKDIFALYSLVVPPSSEVKTLQNEDYSLVALMTKHVKGYKRVCNEFKSQQLILLFLLETVTTAEFKTLLIMKFSNKILADYEKVDYQAELDEIKTNLKNRLTRLAQSFQMYMSKASLEVWRCDPEIYIEDETYFVMQVFQKYISREIDMSWATNCFYDCSAYNTEQTKCKTYQTTIHGSPNKEYYARWGTSCQKVAMCSGILYDCEDKFSARRAVRTCRAPQSSRRRYMYIEHGGKGGHRIGPTHAQVPTCEAGHTWDIRETYSFRQCEICLCTCDDSKSPKADQKINLRVTTADKDHVITNIRWLKRNHTLHIQIEQGKLLSRGKLDPESVHWKDIQEPRNENDTAIINWKLRAFLLHDLKVPKENLLAGVKLTIVKLSKLDLVTFQLLPLAYEYITGKLNYSTPFYEDPDGSVDKGIWDKAPENLTPSEYNIGRGKVPWDKSTQPPSMSVGENQFVRLTTSDFDTDLGQTTIPLFDMQDNIIKPTVPLSGVGIYLKKADEYGGFLGLKPLTLDFSPHMVEKISN